VAITLGKDCRISLAGYTIASARNVVLTESARTIEVNAYGSRLSSVYSTGYECSVQIELNDPVDISSRGFALLHAGTRFKVVGGAGGFSFDAICTGITESDPIDGVVACTIEAKLTDPRLR
jgi:hypothetical protein